MFSTLWFNGCMRGCRYRCTVSKNLGLFEINSFQNLSTWVKGTYFNGNPYCVASRFKGPLRGVDGNPALNGGLHKLTSCPQLR